MVKQVSGDKLLAEWFWVDRWMGSSAFLLPIDARGLYREMLSQAWRRGARLPNDHETIRRAVGVTMKEWSRTWPAVERFWRVDGQYLVNDTQLEVYAEAKARQDKSVSRAQAGAQARWNPERRNSPSNAQAFREQCPPSPITDHQSPEKEKEIPLDEAWFRMLQEYPSSRVERGRIVQDGFIKACLEIGVGGVFNRLERHKQSAQWRKGLVPKMGNYFGVNELWRQDLPEQEPLKDQDSGLSSVTESALRAVREAQ